MDSEDEPEDKDPVWCQHCGTYLGWVGEYLWEMDVGDLVCRDCLRVAWEWREALAEVQHDSDR